MTDDDAGAGAAGFADDGDDENSLFNSPLGVAERRTMLRCPNGSC
jgi:hypothetical protein